METPADAMLTPVTFEEVLAKLRLPSGHTFANELVGGDIHLITGLDPEVLGRALTIEPLYVVHDLVDIIKSMVKDGKLLKRQIEVIVPYALQAIFRPYPNANSRDIAELVFNLRLLFIEDLGLNGTAELRGVMIVIQ